MTECESKNKKLRDLMERHEIDALLLRQVANFAWATCGAASYVNTAATDGASSLLITASRRYLITDNIEATRLRREENLEELGWEFHITPWYETNQTIGELTRSLRLGADHSHPGAADLSREFPRIRAALCTEEDDRFRTLSGICAEAMDRAIHSVRPGMSEYQIAGILEKEVQSRGVQPIVNLIATDERIFHFRHPLPTDKPLDRYAMLILCGRKWGLVCSITRLIYFGRLTDELRLKASAVARIDAQFITATRPGRKLRDIFRQATQAYREQGFADEWQLHHQGGPAGYEPREFLVTPALDDKVSVGQVFAWNPSITGVKSEDTILVGPEENEILTCIPGWPVEKIHLDDGHIERPAILEIT
ncbi:MAG TPA: M24 family metallopeptidase [Anaerolineales bacterium]|nr:M24 family metallopeptidase [Anaerolineales bacterium]